MNTKHLAPNAAAAVKALYDAVEAGAEFPDVVDRIAKSARMPVATLTANYDWACAHDDRGNWVGRVSNENGWVA